MRFQFTLQTLLLSAVVIWSSMAAFGPWGLVLAAIILAAVAYIRSSESMWRAAAMVFLVLLCGGCLLSLLLLPAVQSTREAARRATCINNLKQLALALWNYHDDHGCFPPAYIADADGKPMHSWRVLILPYMEQQALYDQYDFGEPWDGPNNRKLSRVKLSAYECPSSKNATSAWAITNYVAVVGPKTVWPKDKAVKSEKIPDGASNTIMLVEVADSDINWMEPRDLSFEEVLHGLNQKSGEGISGQHLSDSGYFYHPTALMNVAFADGTVHSLPEGLPVEILEALLTIDGGESVDIEHYEDYWPPPRLNWTNCVALATFVVSVILLLVRPRRGEPQGPQSPGVDSRR